MPRRLLLVLFAVWVAFASLHAGGARAAEPQFPLGLRVGLAPPGDAKLSTRFPGFEDADRKMAITILDLPAAAYSDLAAAALRKDQPGLQDVKRESFPFESGIGFLVSGRAQANGETVYRWLLLATTVAGPVENLTTLVSVTVPEAARTIYTDAAIRQALASVTFRPPPVNEQVGLLPFKLGEMAGFRVTQVLPEGGVVLTEGPTDNLATQPYVIVSVGRGSPSEPQDRGRFARDLLSTSPVRDLSTQSAEPMRIGGTPGYEIRATAKGPNNTALSIVQWLRFGTNGFLRVVGVGRTEAWDTLFPRFRAVRDGIDSK